MTVIGDCLLYSNRNLIVREHLAHLYKYIAFSLNILTYHISNYLDSLCFTHYVSIRYSLKILRMNVFFLALLYSLNSKMLLEHFPLWIMFQILSFVCCYLWQAKISTTWSILGGKLEESILLGQRKWIRDEGVGSFHATIDIIYSPFDLCYRCAYTEAHVLLSLPLVLISLMKINEILPSLDSYPNATTEVASSITPVTFWLRSSFLMELASKDNVPYIDHLAFCSFDLRNSFIFFCKKFLFC